MPQRSHYTKHSRDNPECKALKCFNLSWESHAFNTSSQVSWCNASWNGPHPWKVLRLLQGPPSVNRCWNTGQDHQLLSSYPTPQPSMGHMYINYFITVYSECFLIRQFCSFDKLRIILKRTKVFCFNRYVKEWVNYKNWFPCVPFVTQSGSQRKSLSICEYEH